MAIENEAFVNPSYQSSNINNNEGIENKLDEIIKELKKIEQNLGNNVIDASKAFETKKQLDSPKAEDTVIPFAPLEERIVPEEEPLKEEFSSNVPEFNIPVLSEPEIKAEENNNVEEQIVSQEEPVKEEFASSMPEFNIPVLGETEVKTEENNNVEEVVPQEEPVKEEFASNIPEFNIPVLSEPEVKTEEKNNVEEQIVPQEEPVKEESNIEIINNIDLTSAKTESSAQRSMVLPEMEHNNLYAKDKDLSKELTYKPAM